MQDTRYTGLTLLKTFAILLLAVILFLIVPSILSQQGGTFNPLPAHVHQGLPDVVIYTSVSPTSIQGGPSSNGITPTSTLTITLVNMISALSTIGGGLQLYGMDMEFPETASVVVLVSIPAPFHTIGGIVTPPGFTCLYNSGLVNYTLFCFGDILRMGERVDLIVEIYADPVCLEKKDIIAVADPWNFWNEAVETNNLSRSTLSAYNYQVCQIWV